MSKFSLLSKKNKSLLTDPLDDNNPVTVQVLGICSALAITVQLKPAVVMAISVLFVMSVANVVVSLLRKFIPSRIRIIVQLVVIASLVIIIWARGDYANFISFFNQFFSHNIYFEIIRPEMFRKNNYFIHL